MIENGFQFIDIFFSRELWEKIRRPIISVGLFCVLMSFILYLMLPNLVLARVVEPYQKFLSYFSLYQGYGVFAPNPTVRNSHLVGIIYYEDGTMRLYKFPRLERISMLEKLTQERYRKFTEDNLPNPANNHILKDVAVYIARKCNTFESQDGVSNRPKYVLIQQFYSEVPPIHLRLPSPSHFNVKTLCSYSITKEDLE